jgi:hypothetical protein
MRGVRGMALSVAVPVLLFAGATVIGQIVSPARGQPLLPTLPSIVDVALPGGSVAEVYLNSSNAGVNAFHLVAEREGNAVGVVDIRVTGFHAGAAPDSIRLARLSQGHYIGYTVLTPGTWRFAVTATIDGRHAAFSVSRHLS